MFYFSKLGFLEVLDVFFYLEVNSSKLFFLEKVGGFFLWKFSIFFLFMIKNEIVISFCEFVLVVLRKLNFKDKF